MHEYSIVQALFDRIDEEARARRAYAVQRVEIRVGELSGVEVELLRSAYDLFRKGTLCADAELEIRSAPAVWSCPRCESRIPKGAILRCPACRLPARMDGGDEILLERLEMEV